MNTNVDTGTLQEIQHTAETIAREAGALLLAYRGKASILRSKKDFGDIVTDADEASETLIIKKISALYPQHSFLSEERGQDPKTSDWRWIIDPIDGTKEYAKGIPLFAVLMALEYQSELVLGTVHFPSLGDTYSCTRGGGARLNGERIRVSEVSEISASSIYIHLPNGKVPDPLFGDTWSRASVLARHAYRVKIGDMEQFYCPWMAQGGYDGYWLSAPDPGWWDMAPLILLVEEAGGKVTTQKGDKVTEYNYKNDGVVATNGHIHNEFLKLINTL